MKAASSADKPSYSAQIQDLQAEIAQTEYNVKSKQAGDRQAEGLHRQRHRDPPAWTAPWSPSPIWICCSPAA